MENNILDNPVFEQVKIGNKLLPFIKAKRYALKESGSLVNRETVYFNKNNLPALLNVLSGQTFATAKPVDAVASQGGCYVEVVTTDDGLFAAARVYEYVPFEFRALNDMYRYDGQAAADFAAYLAKCKKAVK